MLSRMERLIEYLNTGETLALVGAGVSRELGIPTWKELCDKLLARIPPQFEKRKDEPVRLLKAEAYDAFTGWISRNVGPEFLYENTREILADAGRTGSVSEFVAKYPFKSVFTTNFDNSLKRHFNAVGKAVDVFVNSEGDLASVDIDLSPCIVKIHSDLDHTESIVFTDTQYAQARSKGTFEYYRKFVLRD